METAAGGCIGGTARDYQLLKPKLWLPFTGGSFGEDGDDGSLCEGCRFLCQVAKPIDDKIRDWAPQMTSRDGRIFSHTLFQFTPVPPMQHGSWSSAACQTVTSLPTAHEAACCWLDRFRRIATEVVPSLVGDDEAVWSSTDMERCTAFFAGIKWNCETSVDLLAGIEQERRWLGLSRYRNPAHDQQPSNDYYETWHAEQEPILDAIADPKSQPHNILDILSKHDALKKDDLFSRAWLSNQPGEPTGAFNRALSKLKEAGLISSGRGAASVGYSLTIKGRIELQRLKSKRT